MRRAIYPGSFDPITNGHVDIAERALRLFDEVIVAVAHNSMKNPTFSTEQRMDLARETLEQLPDAKGRITITTFSGLLVDFAMEHKASAIVRGLRAISDFEFEFQLALMNRQLEPRIETIFLMPKDNCVYLSSRIVKEIARLGGNIGEFVPTNVKAALQKHYSGVSA